MKRMTLFIAIFSAALIATVFVATQYGPAASEPVAAAAHATMGTPF